MKFTAMENHHELLKLIKTVCEAKDYLTLSSILDNLHDNTINYAMRICECGHYHGEHDTSSWCTKCKTCACFRYWKSLVRNRG
jgi:hypothetical protein